MDIALQSGKFTRIDSPEMKFDLIPITRCYTLESRLELCNDLSTELIAKNRDAKLS